MSPSCPKLTYFLLFPWQSSSYILEFYSNNNVTDTSYWLFIDYRACAENSSDDVREAVAQTLGVMACIFTLSNNTTAENGEQLRPKLEEVICPACDKGMPNPTATRELSPHEGVNCNTLTPLTIWQPLFAKLLLNESSERVQVCPSACLLEHFMYLGSLNLVQIIAILNSEF